MTVWTKVRLGECCDIVSGATPSTGRDDYWGGNICWATPKDLSSLDGHYISDTPRKLTEAGLVNCSATILPPNSVLFSSRAPIGHVAINLVPMATNQGFKSFVPGPEVDAKYLFHWLRANRSFLEGLGVGATFKEVSKAVVTKVEVPLPPFAEQRRIAAILDKADALRTKRREALVQLDRLAQSIFLEMFGDPVNNPKRWLTCNFDKFFVDRTSACEKIPTSEYQEVGKYPVIDQGKAFIAAYCNDKSLLAPVEPPITVFGDHTRIVKFVDYPFVVGADGAKVLKAQPEVNARFASHLLASLPIPNLGYSRHMKEIKRFSFINPPRELQNEFESRLRKVGKVKKSQQLAESDADALFRVLQHSAFGGKL